MLDYVVTGDVSKITAHLSNLAQRQVPFATALALTRTAKFVEAKIKEDLKVTATDDSLTVRGETRKETDTNEKNVHRQEIRYGAFQRTMALPADVDPAGTRAELENGVLTVTLPKAAQSKAKRIDVAVK